MRKFISLVHRQAVHVGTQADASPAGFLVSSNDTYNPGLGQAPVDLHAPARELLRDQVGGAALAERELGVRVDIAAHGGELGVIAADAFYGGHVGWALPMWFGHVAAGPRHSR